MNRHRGCWSRRHGIGRHHAGERLEERMLLAVGDLAHEIAAPSTSLLQEAAHGWSVATNGEATAVSTLLADPTADRAGQVTLYDNVTGELRFTLRSQMPTGSGRFGNQVRITQEQLAVASTVGDIHVFDVADGSLNYVLQPPAGVSTLTYGSALSLTDEYVLVGVPGDDGDGTDSGLVLLHDSATGSLLRTFRNPSDSVRFDEFGYSVAATEDYAVIGARWDDRGASNAGTAYVFDITTGQLLHTLDNPTPSGNDQFGYAVGVSGERIVVGARSDDTGAAHAGSAYVFDASSGELLHTINNPEPAVSDEFGAYLSVSGSTAVISAWRDNAFGGDSGIAYLFDVNSGEQLDRLSYPSAGSQATFGSSVSIRGDAVAVGAPRSNEDGLGVGQAFLFSASTATLAQTFVSDAMSSRIDFGRALAIDGNRVLVGAPGYAGPASTSGAAFLIDAVSGSVQQRIDHPTLHPGAQFGNAVAIAGDRLVIGAHRDTRPESFGHVFVTDLEGATQTVLSDPAPAELQYGYAVAADEQWIAVGAPALGVRGSHGAVYVYDASTYQLRHTILNPTVNPLARFGWSVSISDNVLAVGAPGANGDQGQVFSYWIPSGVLRDSFSPSNSTQLTRFGTSVSIVGDRLAVGAPLGADGGNVEVFDAVLGESLRVIDNPEPTVASRFGTSVALSGGLVVAGTDARDDIGAAYVFDHRDGTLIDKLAGFDEPGDSFGLAVAIDQSSRIVVGAPDVDGSSWDRGAIAIYAADGANVAPLAVDDVGATNENAVLLVDVITNDIDPNTTDRLTLASATLRADPIDSAGNTIVPVSLRIRAIGNQIEFDPGNDFLGLQPGESATVVIDYVVSDDNASPATDTGTLTIQVNGLDNREVPFGTFVRTIANPNQRPQALARFGQATAADQAIVVFGSPWADTGGAGNAGHIAIVDHQTGQLLHEVNNPVPQSLADFGYSVDVDTGRVLVGAPGYDDGPLLARNETGRAYLVDAESAAILHVFENPSLSKREDRFGTSVALFGNRVVIGAPREGTEDVGVAYLFDGSGNLVRTIANPDAGAGDRFGSSVAISEEFVVIGAVHGNSGAGQAHVFDSATGQFLHTLANPTPDDGDLFATSIAIEGTTVLIGAPGDDRGAADAGVVHQFEIDTDSNRLVRTTPAPSGNVFEANFGHSVALRDNWVIVGAPGQSAGRGAVYLYHAFSPELIGAYQPETVVSPRLFGSSVALSPDVWSVIATAPATSLESDNSGVGFIYPLLNTTPRHTVFSPIMAGGDRFGGPDNSVLFSRGLAVAANRMLVSAPNTDTVSADEGIAYLYNTTTGDLIAELDSGSTERFVNFGTAVTLSEEFAVVGMPRFDFASQRDAGAVVVYDAANGEFIRTFFSDAPADFAQFGRALAIGDDVLLIGEWFRDGTESREGAVAVVEPRTGTRRTPLVNPDPAADDNFGASLAARGTRALVGVPGSSRTAPRAGAAWLMDIESGTALQVFDNPSPGSDDKFGTTLELTDSYAIIGTQLDDTLGTDRGRVYIFDHDGELQHTLENPLPLSYQSFGRSLAAVGDLLLVAAKPLVTSQDVDDVVEKVFVFQLESGQLVDEIDAPTSSAPDNLDEFGATVAGDPNSVIAVAAPRADGGTLDRGAVHVYTAQANLAANSAPVAAPDTAATVAGSAVVDRCHCE